MKMTEQAPSQHDVDALIEQLTVGEKAWAGAPVAERSDLLLQVMAAVEDTASEWVRIATQVKELDSASPLVGEEWISGPYAVTGYAQALKDTLDRLAEGTPPLAGYNITDAPGERLAIQVLPHHRFDKVLLNSFRAEVWTRPGVTERQLRSSVGLGQRTPEQTNGVALVLGAGNIFSIPPLDVLYQLYAENRTVVLKLNPITDPLLEVFRAVFKPMTDRNLVEIVSGGAEIGSALAHHRGIAAVHMTGSAETHDAIMWGPGQVGVAAKADRAPRLAKPMTSELGGICPIIVVPGSWSQADLRFQAEHVATQRLHNGGSNCIAGQIVILSADWTQKDEFLAALRQALESAPARPAWYPGCDARVRSARDTHPTAEAVGGTPERTMLTGLDLSNASEPAFVSEYFGPVLGVAELPGTGEEFLDAAVAAANDRLLGTLGATIIVHPRTIRSLGSHLREAIADLRYGTVGVNAWTGLGFLTPRATWGAYPGHTPDDVQSGIGVVHNALLLAGTERTVLTGPFRPWPRSVLNGEWSVSPKPPWFVTNRTAATTCRLLSGFVARPRWRALPSIFASALRG